MFLEFEYNKYECFKFTENNSFNIIPSKNKLAGKSLIIIVQSRPDAFEARQANRDTWIKKGKTIVLCYFMCLRRLN